MRVRIKLQYKGIKHQPRVWLVAQPVKKNLKGKYLEHIGIWQPMTRKTVMRHISMNIHRAKYWLSVGASPTKGAHKVMARFGLLPPLPCAYGSGQSYEKPERVYPNRTYFRFLQHRKPDAPALALHYKQKLLEEMNLVERKRRLAAESISNVGGPLSRAEALIDSEAEDTEEIDSDEADIFERTKKFEKVLKKFN